MHCTLIISTWTLWLNVLHQPLLSPLVFFKMLSPLWSSADAPTKVFSHRDSNTVEQAACPGQNRMCSWYAEQQGKSEEAGSTQNASWGELVSSTSNSFCFWEGLKCGICLQKSWYIQEGDKCYLHIGTDCSWNSSEGILKDFSLFAMTLLCGVHATFCPATPAFACFTREASDSWNPNTSIYHQSEHKSNRRSFEEMTDTLLCFQIPLLDAISDSTLY